MTLRELRKTHPNAFMEQDWFDGERFMERPVAPGSGLIGVPTGVEPVRPRPQSLFAGTLAAIYVENPDDLIWQKYLWTSDIDDLGQRIYVGGIGQAKKPGFQIHRHLHIDDKWGWPTWA